MSSIKEVAKKANVSVSSVSLAYHKPHQLSEKTRHKILKIADELGYKPNIKKLNSTFKTIAIAVPVRDKYHIQVPLVGLLAELLFHNDYGTIMIEYESIEALNAQRKYVKAEPSNIKGLIVICTEDSTALDVSDVPMVIVNPHSVTDPTANISSSIHTVLSDKLDEFFQEQQQKVAVVVEKKFLEQDYIKGVQHELYEQHAKLSTKSYKMDEIVCTLEGTSKDFEILQEFYDKQKPDIWFFIGVHSLNIAQSTFSFPMRGVVFQEEHTPCSVKPCNDLAVIVRPLSKIATQTTKLMLDLIEKDELKTNRQIQILI